MTVKGFIYLFGVACGISVFGNILLFPDNFSLDSGFSRRGYFYNVLLSMIAAVLSLYVYECFLKSWYDTPSAADWAVTNALVTPLLYLFLKGFFVGLLYLWLWPFAQML